MVLQTEQANHNYARNSRPQTYLIKQNFFAQYMDIMQGYHARLPRNYYHPKCTAHGTKPFETNKHMSINWVMAPTCTPEMALTTVDFP